MNDAYLIVGGNQGNVLDTFRKVKIELKQQIGEIISESYIYRTAAWGHDKQPDYLNQVLSISSKLSADEVLNYCLAIEVLHGRVRNPENQWAPRTIDIDILYYGNEIINTAQLTLPHPRLHQRNFVLVPLVEIAAELIHPIFQKSNAQLLEECVDQLEVNEL
ncbi:2-amino-4-hydroxy-6-hydroxymethyldihydropteridine diphosphokinase [bacterium]|jgi:2-amino-4-hydroxy-6-hydroxymethyldihydropteridine diphosphokinase|nr:2-amino-4-hydroxy-6-hydroxymethyldihydropteridine diphosphokinase [bacterium]